MTDTNWELDSFDLIQESGGNILTEDSLYICLEELDTTVWEIETGTGSG